MMVTKLRNSSLIWWYQKLETWVLYDGKKKLETWVLYDGKQKLETQVLYGGIKN